MPPFASIWSQQPWDQGFSKPKTDFTARDPERRALQRARRGRVALLWSAARPRILGDSILIGGIVRSISLVALVWAPIAAAQTPETVSFLSADGTTLLTGFVFSPKGPGRFPAVVMLHGRTGPFGSAAAREARFDAGALSMRHQLWGRFWAERGYVAIHVDSFTPRGYG